MDITEACQLFDTVMNEKSSSIERCSTGIGNYVFIVSTHTAKYVLRCATEINAYNNTVHWLSRLQTCDIPIPKVLDVGRFENYEYLILSYTVGKDIGDIYIELTDGEKQQIFQCLVFGQAVQSVSLDALLHAGAVLRVEIFVCHFFTSHLYVLLVLLYTVKRLLPTVFTDEFLKRTR